MFKAIDNFLNNITMYRLAMWCLAGLLGLGFFFSAIRILPYNFIDFCVTFALLFVLCISIDFIFSSLFSSPWNIESSYITIFILALIVSPVKPLENLDFILLASLGAVSSKYLIAIGKKHVFNPAAFGVAIATLIVSKYAVWWIATLAMAPAVLLVGILIVRKIQRTDLVLSFLATSLVLTLGYGLLHGQNIMPLAQQLAVDSPWMFLAFIMLTEPATTPPKRYLRIIYGAMVGILFAPFANIAGFYFTPEIALLAGNIFSYLASPKQKLILTLRQKIKASNNVYDFIFAPQKPIWFTPGQYMEWTLDHKNQDNRGIRRYFTVASSPTEKNIKIGVKFYEKPSSYKQALEQIQEDKKIVAGQIAGDFTLPKNKHKKLVFLAGGIGVTPFRSMIKYLIDTKEKRDIIMFYANRGFSDIAYRDVFDEARRSLGIRTIYVLNETRDIPEGFVYEKGPITAKAIQQMVPDFKERIFYISGPKAMIDSFKVSLLELGIPRRHIKTDFFPGYA